MGIDKLHQQLRALGDKNFAALSQGFFKTGPGQYGEGDRFIGVRVPALRKLSKQWLHLDVSTVTTLLHSPIHEERMLALLIWLAQFKRGDGGLRREIYRSYLANTGFINNWDLVDLSAPHIVGGFLEARTAEPLHDLVKSTSLWERRIAILATLYNIRHHQYDATLALAEQLLKDREDLIHKAVGWMLREVGKRDLVVEEQFLKKHYRTMPRTMLRYAIERFPEAQRKGYLQGHI